LISDGYFWDISYNDRVIKEAAGALYPDEEICCKVISLKLMLMARVTEKCWFDLSGGHKTWALTI